MAEFMLPGSDSREAARATPGAGTEPGAQHGQAS